MTYLEAVALIHDIESKYDVMSIKYKGISVWSFLRLRLVDCISVKSEIKASRSIIWIVLKALFYSSPFLFLKKFDIWAISAAERRKSIGDKMVQRISGAITQLPYKSLMIEKPSVEYGHIDKKYIEEKNVVSESILLILTHFFMGLSLIKKSDIEKHDVLEEISSEFNLEFDYLYYVKLLDAQYKAMNTILRISRKPRLVLFECPYFSMGYTWAFHKHGLKVIELQHGVLNKNHYGYNAKDYDTRLCPDSIGVFGIEEDKYFKYQATKYTSDVNMTGLYMLELADKYFINDIFSSERKKYKKIVIASGQSWFEDALATFIDNIAQKHPEILFVYIPRTADVNLQFNNKNIRLVKEANIYEYLKWADLHITISSTTCLEACYFHKPTLFYNYQNMSSSYYGQVLTIEDAVAYINSENDFDKAYDYLLTNRFTYKEIFAHDNIANIEKTIKKFLN